MRKGKVQLKRIEDKHSRQVTFSKRRTGLMKKARELAVLCDVDIALIVFSSRGRLYEFSSGDSLVKTLERYKIHMEKEAAVCNRVRETKEDASASTDQQTIQRFEIKDIDSLNMVELTQLERQQDALLRQITFKKTQKAMEAITAFRDKEEQMRKEKRSMEKQISEMLNDVGGGGELELCNNGGPLQPPLLPLL